MLNELQWMEWNPNKRIKVNDTTLILDGNRRWMEAFDTLETFQNISGLRVNKKEKKKKTRSVMHRSNQQEF